MTDDENRGLNSSQTTEVADELPTLAVSGIAEYIRFDCCPRFFKLRFEGDEEKKLRWPEAFKPVSPLLIGAGKELEEHKAAELKAKAADFYDQRYFDFETKEYGWEFSWKKASNEIRQIIVNQLSNRDNDPKPVLFYQVPMTGRIGIWNIHGLADLIAVWSGKKGRVRVRIFEIKSSWKEQTAHRIQVAIYALLLKNAIKDLPFQIEFEGGVINKESDLKVLDPEVLPLFRLDPLIQDIQRMLSENGEIFRIHKTPLDRVDYRLSWRCDSCTFNECCIVRAVEKESISLMNLTRGEQNALRRHGIACLEDLARLKFVPSNEDLRPYNFKEIPARDTQKVGVLSADLVIGPRLDWLIQRAQFMLHGIRPDSHFANRAKVAPWLTGTGYGGLPEDSPVMGTDSALSYFPNGMIRVYLHVQWDYMLDILSMISARVSCTLYRGEPISVSEIVRRLPDDRTESLEEERLLLERFFLELSIAINKIAQAVGSPDEAPIHLYFYSRRERDRLMDAVRRQPSLISARAVRDLLGLRQAIDQPMFSILQDELKRRKSLRFHSTGLLPVLEQFGFYDHQNWTGKRLDGSVVDLRSAFRDGFFNYALPFDRRDDGSLVFNFRDERIKQRPVFYPARARFGNQIPIEYLWGAKNKLEHLEKGKNRLLIEKRKWCDYPYKTRRITDEEITLMGTKLCQALEHIERSINIRNRRLGKKPICIPKIDEFSLGPATLERSCREFLDLEYFAKRQELYQYYALLPFQRVASGRSLIFECTYSEQLDREFVVSGRLVYEGVGLPSSDCYAASCRVKGSDESSSGDWMVITELRRNTQGQFEEANDRSPSEVEKSARVIVKKVDIKNMQISVKVVSWPSGKNRKYSVWHNLPTTDTEKAQNKYLQLFERGRFYILDEMADDIISERATECLDYVDSNSLYRLLSGFLSGENDYQQSFELSKEDAESFLSWVENSQLRPKPEQQHLIEKIFGSEQIIMLQGPPGTGKTVTLQLAVLAHIAAHRVRSKCRVLMVAPTHKAIQEFVDKLATSWGAYCKEGAKDLADLTIYRVLNSDVSSEEAVDGVTYLNYNEDEKAVSRIRESLMGQSKLTSEESDGAPMILCVTPPGMYGLMKKIGGLEPPWGEGFFDLLVVDEASMMRVPELILSGSFIKKTAKILIAGDHRQLPPIQAHNWEKEDRRTLEEMAAFLSAQDFLRLLRQEDLGIERLKRKTKADIPAVRLSETHRCHQVVADFLREWVYNKDKIDFRSDQKQTLEPLNAPTEGLQTALKPENVFVLIVHDEAESFQSNLVESKIVDALVRNVECDRVGIVTPHNAQRGLLKNLLIDGYENVRVDTVERYQGGESDFIIISSTVSDPDYVRSESDFLLNLNRINVAISRMKKKLIIVASRSIFEFMPQDARDYDKAILWRGISQTVGFTADSKPIWTGSLSEFLGKKDSNVKIEIYAKPAYD